MMTASLDRIGSVASAALSIATFLSTQAPTAAQTCPGPSCSTVRSLSMSASGLVGARTYSIGMTLTAHQISGIPCPGAILIQAFDPATTAVQNVVGGPNGATCTIWSSPTRTFVRTYAESSVSTAFTRYYLRLAVDPGNCRSVVCTRPPFGPFYKQPTLPFSVQVRGTLGDGVNSSALDVAAASAGSLTFSVGAWAPTGSPGVLAFGLRPSNLPLLGGDLLVDPATVFATVSYTLPTSGPALMPTVIPPGFATTVHVQAFTLDRAAPQSLWFSNALQVF